MAEERFLKQRIERDAARSAARSKDEDSASPSLPMFFSQVAAAKTEIEKHLSAGDVEQATAGVGVLQSLASTSGSEVVPAHDRRALNTAIAEYVSRISEKKSAAKPAKKFGFSSKEKLVSVAEVVTAPCDEARTSTGDDISTSGEVISDRCNEVIHVPSAKAVFIRRCKGCIILAVPTEGSFFLSDCEACVVYCAPHQLRVKSCQDMAFYTWCMSRPVIESSTRQRFGGYDAWAGLLVPPGDAPLRDHADWVSHVGKFTDVAAAQARFADVDDFHWLRQSQSPNWQLIPKEEWRIDDTPRAARTVQ